MAESKYKVIKVINQSEWTKKCPLFLVRSQVILHTESGKLFAVNEFANIGFQNVKECVVRMECRDASGNVIGNVDNCAYQNIDIARNSVFGGNKLFGLPDNTEDIAIVIKSVTCADGSTFNNVAMARGVKVENPIVIDTKDEAYDVLAKRVLEEGVQTKFWPQKFVGGWRCTCAQINDDEVDTCPLCGVKKDFAVNQMNRAEILAYKERVKREEEERIAREAEEARLAAIRAEEERQAAIRAEEERKRKEEEERIRAEEEARLAAIRAEEERKAAEEAAKKAEERARLDALMAKKEAVQKYNMRQRTNTLKRNFILICLAIVLVIGAIGAYNVIQLLRRSDRYDRALKAKNAYEYETAINGFRSLGKYRDAESKIKETQYEYAEYLTLTNEYQKSIELYKVLGWYKDSAQLIPQTYLKWGDFERENHNYAEALDYYDHAGSLASSEVKYDLSFEYGKYLYEQQEFDKAIEVLDTLGVRDMTGVPDIIAGCYYGLGKNALYQNDLENAILDFNHCLNMNDANELIRRAYYLYGQKYEASKDYESAFNSYVNAGEYQDATDRKEALLNKIAEKYASEKNYNRAASYYSQIDNLDQVENKDLYYQAMYNYAEFMLKSNITDNILDIYKALPASKFEDAPEKAKAIEQYIGYTGTYKAQNEDASVKELYVRLNYSEADKAYVLSVNGNKVDLATMKSENITLNKTSAIMAVDGKNVTYLK